MTKQILVGGVPIGGGAPVVIQSMLNTKTTDVEGALRQITQLASAGCQIAQLAVPNREAARGFAEICKERGLDKETESLAAQPVQEIAVQEPEPVTAPDNGCVPDPAISVESMNAYGYTDSNMLPLTKERALELMERDVSVYMLHTDNTEAMAFDAEEVRSFRAAGL